MKPLNAIIFIVLLCLCPLAGMATDNPNYFLQHFDNSNGLPQNSVNGIVQDKNGYIWLITESGLVRFDGERFKVIDMSSIALSSIRFYVIFLNRSGNVVALNEKNEAIQMVDGMPMRYTFHPDTNRNYFKWYHPLVENHTGSSYNVSLPNLTELWGVHINELKLYSDEKSFYLYKHDTVRYVQDKDTSYAVPFRGDSRGYFFILDGQFFHIDQAGQVTTFGHQTKRSPLKGEIQLDPLYHHSDPANNVQPFWNSYDANHLLVYFNHAIYLVKRDDKHELVTRKLVSDFDATGKEILRAFYSEQDGRLFLGSNTKGLFVLSLQQFVTKNVGTGTASFYSQLPYGTDGVLLPNGYILRHEGESTKLRPFKGWAFPDSYTISTDGQGGGWTRREDLLYHISLHPFRLLTSVVLPAPITMLYHDDKDLLWIGMKGGKGVAVLDENRKDAKPEMLYPLKSDITYFAKVTPRQMCVGTDLGLFLLDPVTGKVDTVKGLEGQYIRSITVTGAGEIWATTYDRGFYLYHKGRLTHFPYDVDKYIATAHCIVPDRKGFFWITTNRGLFQVSKQDLLAYAENGAFPLYYHYYDKVDGFNSNEFNGGCQPCAVNLDNGYISLPSINGMVFFNPDSIKPVLPEGEMIIDHLVLDNSPLPVDKELKLPGDFSSLQITYSCAYMGNNKNLLIRYALIKDKGDTIWLPLPSDGKITLSTLLPGNYRLVVRKMNGFGYGNFSDKVLKLEVPNAWYETGWWYAACVLLFLFSSWLFARLRVRYIQRKAFHLEMMVNLKTKELKEKTALQERIVQSVSHNVLSPLQYQQLLSEKILLEVKEKGTVSTRIVQVLNDHTSYLYHMVANLLKYFRTQVAMEPARNYYSLAASVENIRKIFLAIALENGTQIRNDIPASLMLWGDEQLLSVMLYNLVDNAVKVTKQGMIVMEVIAEDDAVSFRVRDTGPGVNDRVRSWFNQPVNEVAPLKGLGIGLLIVKELATAEGMKVTLESCPGEGSIVTIAPIYRHARF
jgi:signal transduction histidine kinase/sugar lactone lactonase YvrE